MVATPYDVSSVFTCAASTTIAYFSHSQTVFFFLFKKTIRKISPAIKIKKVMPHIAAVKSSNNRSPVRRMPIAAIANAVAQTLVNTRSATASVCNHLLVYVFPSSVASISCGCICARIIFHIYILAQYVTLCKACVCLRRSDLTEAYMREFIERYRAEAENLS